MFKISDRVKEISTTTGSGSVVLGGAYGSFRAFSETLSSGDVTFYCIENLTSWEVGSGTYDSSSNSLSRDHVLSSSDSGDKINLGGTSTVFCTLPADRTFVLDPDGETTVLGLLGGSGIVSTLRASDLLVKNNAVVSGVTNLKGDVTADQDITVTQEINANNINSSGEITSSGFLTLLRPDSAGNYFHAYKNDVSKQTIALHTDGSASPLWKLGLKTSPSSQTDAPTFAYIYARDGSAGIVGNTSNYVSISSSDGLTTHHDSHSIFIVDSDNGGIFDAKSTTSPALRVQGAALMTGDLQRWEKSDSTVLSVVDSGGKVGILTSSPSYELEVAGTGSFDTVRWADGTIQTTAAAGGDSLPAASGANITQNTVDIGTVSGLIPSSSSFLPAASGGTITAISGWAGSTITNEIASLVDSAPAALDTLNEIAAAINDDANIATTLTNSITSNTTAINASGNYLLGEIRDNSASGTTNASNITSNTSLVHSSGNYLLGEVRANSASGSTNASSITSNTALVHSSGNYLLGEVRANSASGTQNASDIVVVSGLTGGGGLPVASGAKITANTTLIHSSGNYLLGEIRANSTSGTANASNITSNTSLVHSSGNYLLGEIRANTASGTAISGWAGSTITNEINSLIDGAPGTLDTLNEIAAAINDDANISTTLTNSITANTTLIHSSGNYLLGEVRANSASGTTNASNIIANTSLVHSSGNYLLGEVRANSASGTTNASSITANSVSGVAISGIAAYASGIFNGAIDEANLKVTNTPTDNYLLSYDHASTGFTWVAAAGGGSMSNFIITDGSTPQTVDDGETITFTDGTGAEFVTSATNTVTVNSVDSEIVHDNLSGFVANEHLDWTNSVGTIHAGNYTDTVYTLPEANATTKGGIELFSNTDQSVAATAVSATAARTYGLQLNSDGQGVVNVPWVDTNTTYSVGDGGLTTNDFTSADHTKLDGIEASATADQTNGEIKTAIEAGTDIALGGNPTTTTQSAANNSTRIATTAYADAAAAAVVDSAPGALNTLNELAAALGDDASFSTTVTNLIATKMPLAGGAFSGAVTTNSTFDGVDIAVRDAILTTTTTTANAALPKTGGAMTGAITTNSTFDGVDIATRDAVLTSTTTTANAALPKAGGAMVGAITTNSTFDGRDVATDGTKLDAIEASATADQSDSEIKTLLEDGIDSVHYVDGSIDLIHLAADSVDGTKIADNAINSEHYTDGSIDEPHLNVTNTPSDNFLLSYDLATTGFTWVAAAGGGSMSSFIITDGSTSQTVDDGETITFSDGTGAEFVTSATNTVTVNSVDSEIVHDNLSGFVAAEHLDWTANVGTIHAGNYTDTNTQLSQEQVEDYVGGMLGGTETLIAVTYQDSTGDIDFVVDNDLSNYDNSSSGFITATLTTEAVQDIAGGLITVAGGTKTGISITYDDTNNNMDFVVDHDAASNFVANEHVDHTSVTLTAGDGLTGGGTIAANRSFAVDINGTADLASPAVADELLISDADDSNTVKKADLASIVNLADHDALTNFVTAEHVDWAASSAGTIHATNYTDTTYSVGDGGLTQINFTSADNSKLDGIDASANNYTLPSASLTVVGGVELATTGETTTGTDATRAVTPAGVQAAIDALVGGAPGALDTLNELAAAINDDASYASTITTALALKSTIASPTFTGTVAIPSISDLEAAVTANTAKATNVSTNLSATANGTSLTVESSDGTNVALPAATISAWGVMSDDQATKLDGIEASADVTDATNVAAAGALMDSELTDIAAVKATEDPFTAALLSKLNAIEASADVTDATNVAAAGALMDSEVTNLAFVKALAKGISDGNVLTANDVVADDDFLRINGTEVEGLTVAEVLTALNVEAGADVTDATNVTAAGALMDSELAGIVAVKATTGTFLSADESKLDGIEASADVTDATNVTAAGALMDSECAGLAALKLTTGTFLTADQTKLDGIETSADVTDATNVTAAGALMDSEVTNLATVKALAIGISDGNFLTANDVVADNDFLRIDGTEVEGRTASEVLSDIAAAPAAGNSSIVTVGTIGTGTWQGTAIATTYIADDAITLAKLAGGTDGQIITFDADGDPVAVGPGTDGQVLTSTGVGSPPAFEDSGGGLDAANGASDRIATFSDSDSLNGEANLTFDGGILTLNGGLVKNTDTVTATTYTVDATGTDSIILADGTSNAIAITLPDAAVGIVGRILTIKKIDSSTNAVDIIGSIASGYGADDIDEFDQKYVLYVQHDTITIVCGEGDGTASNYQWWIIAEKVQPHNALLLQTSAQSIANNTSTAITMDSVSFEQGADGDAGNNQIKITRPGKYLCGGGLTMTGMTNAKMARVYIGHYDASATTTIYYAASRGSSTSDGNPQMLTSVLLDLAVNDTIKLYSSHLSGSSENTGSATGGTFRGTLWVQEVK
jgi:hypothetical protein